MYIPTRQSPPGQRSALRALAGRYAADREYIVFRSAAPINKSRTGDFSRRRYRKIGGRSERKIGGGTRVGLVRPNGRADARGNRIGTCARSRAGLSGSDGCPAIDSAGPRVLSTYTRHGGRETGESSAVCVVVHWSRAIPIRATAYPREPPPRVYTYNLTRSRVYGNAKSKFLRLADMQLRSREIGGKTGAPFVTDRCTRICFFAFFSSDSSNPRSFVYATLLFSLSRLIRREQRTCPSHGKQLISRHSKSEDMPWK